MINIDKNIIIILASIFVVIMPVLTLVTGVYYYAFLAILLLLSIKYIGNRSVIFILALWSVAIGIKAPIGRFMVSDLLYFWVSLISLLAISLDRKSYKLSLTYLDKLIILFSINLLIIIFFRGSGLYILGDDKIGGGAYLLWIASLTGLFFSKYVNLSLKQAKLLILGWIILPLLNPFLEWLTIKSGGSLYVITKYFNVSYERLYETLVQETEMIRSSTAPISTFFQIMGIFILSRRQNLFLFIIFSLIGAAMIMFSGFRSYLVAYSFITFLSAFFIYKRRSSLIIFSLITGFLSLVFIALFIEYMPFSIQRTLSFIPGLNVDIVALENANETTLWRVKIWQFALADITKYAIIGKGLAWEINTWTNLFSTGWYVTPEFFYANHNYHSGPITLIIDYGLPGTIIWLLLQIYIFKQLRKSFKYAIFTSSKSIISVFYIYGCIMIFWDILHFWLIYGQTQWMQRFISYFILLRILQPVVDKIYLSNQKNIIKVQ